MLGLDVIASADLPAANRRSVMAAAAIILVMYMAILCPKLSDLPRSLSTSTENPNEVSFRYLKAHPGQVYFPWYPLSEVLAEGRLYHSENGVGNRIMAGYTPRDGAWRNYIPPHFTLVAYYPPQKMETPSLFAQFRQRAAIPGLEGWTVYERSSGNSPVDQPN